MKIGESAGLKIFVSPEEFEEIKKQKIIQENKILEEQQNKIDKQKEVLDKIKEYINRTEINSVGKPLAYTEIGKELLEILEEIE